MKATLSNARHTPRKMRLVADLIKGKSVLNALNVLSVAPKRAAESLEKLLRSALANAKNSGVPTDNLIVKECRVDQGFAFKRSMPGARGSAMPVKKHTSHVNLVLAEKVEPKSTNRPKKITNPKKLTS